MCKASDAESMTQCTRHSTQPPAAVVLPAPGTWQGGGSSHICWVLPLQDVEPLQPIRPQLCKRANSLEDAFSQMKGKPFVSEVKFDGVRMQVWHEKCG